MKFKIFSTVLILAVIFTIGFVYHGCPRIAKIERAVLDAKEKAARAAAQAAKVEEERIQKLPNHIQSLVGVKGICVLINNLPNRAKSTGLTEEQLQTDVELKLRQAGIKVNSWEEYHASEDMAYVFVNITTASHNDSPTIVSRICVNFTQRVRLLRSPFTTVLASTWEKSRLCMPAKKEFPEEARKQVKNRMDYFIRDYLKANPKK
jgi:hypothetical protein